MADATTYGKDVRCLDSLSTGRTVRGPLIVGQRCYHRLVTTRGMLRGGEDEENFGIDLAELVGSLTGGSERERIKGIVEGELRKEAEVDSVDATVLDLGTGATRSYQITIRAVTGEGPFELVLKVSDVTVDLLKLDTLEAA
jgi:hypothetical protein